MLKADEVGRIINIPKASPLSLVDFLVPRKRDISTTNVQSTPLSNTARRYLAEKNKMINRTLSHYGFDRYIRSFVILRFKG